MKKIIEEVKSGNNGSMYIRSIVDDDNKVLFSRKVAYYLKTIQKDNKTIIMLYNTNMDYVESAYKYLNLTLRNKSINTRMLYANVIKHLYIYADLIETKLKDFTYEDFVKFQYYLLGYNSEVTSEYMYTYSGMNYQVMSKYMNVCKEYMHKCHLKNTKYIEVVSNEIARKNTSGRLECPKFISYEQMEQFIRYIDSDHTLTYTQRLEYKAIYSLMEYGGLRIGEVLGLTIQDMDQTDSAELPNHKIIAIRNRVSDRKDQQAKTCLNVNDKKNYKDSNYWENGIGYQKAYIPNDTFDLVIDYYHNVAYKFERKGRDLVKADDVYGKGNRNFYIFHNKNLNTILDVKTLREYTKKMFEYFHIPIDSMKRRNNLLHRFRHGYIMHLLYVVGWPAETVIKYSRHTSTASLEPYNNPTDEQLGALLDEMDE